MSQAILSDTSRSRCLNARLRIACRYSALAPLLTRPKQNPVPQFCVPQEALQCLNAPELQLLLRSELDCDQARPRGVPAQSDQDLSMVLY